MRIFNSSRTKNQALNPGNLGLSPYLCAPAKCRDSGFVFQPGKKQFFNQKNRVMNNYELMVIFTPILSDDEFKAAQKKYTTLVTDNGGQVVAENPWGLKSLAYPIQKKTTGLYWVTEFITPSDFNEKLKIQLLRDEGVLRHMVTKLDKYAVEYNHKKRSGVPTGTEKVQEA
jgi:small subunit ribosomal protein S6